MRVRGCSCDMVLVWTFNSEFFLKIFKASFRNDNILPKQPNYKNSREFSMFVLLFIPSSLALIVITSFLFFPLSDDVIFELHPNKKN